MTAHPLQVGFLGAGRMATALAAGWLRAGLVTVSACQASAPSPSARHAFAEATGCTAGSDNRAVVAASNLLVLAVKPQTMPALLAELHSQVTGRHLVLSIAAGVTLRQLTAGLGVGCRL